jgi:hypothetical protein
MRMSRFRLFGPTGRVLAALLVLGSSVTLGMLFLPGSATPVQAAAITYRAALSGPAEDPPADSPGTGFARVDIDTTAHTMRVQVSFSGLVAPTIASHIHACTTLPLIGTASVATQTPSFIGFPLGVTSGTYDRTFNTLDPATYRAGFLTANGGTAAGAEAALAACLAAGKAYLNVHSTTFPNGEIRGFLLPGPVDKAGCKSAAFQTFSDPRTLQPFRNLGQCVSFVDNSGQ